MNGFVRRQLAIGSRQPIHQHKHCDKCDDMKPPEGGIQMSSSKWYCAPCWTKRITNRNLK